MRAIVKFEIGVPVEIFEGECAYIARCPVLNISTQGESRQHARENLIDAITLFLHTCFDMGTLDEVLKDCGFKPVQGVVQEEPAADDMNFINIPLPFMIPDNFPAVCRA